MERSREEILEYIKEEIVNYIDIPEESVSRVFINEVDKNNGVKRTGLTIQETNQTISPVIYLDSYLEQYQEGNMEIDEILENVAEFYNTHRKESLELPFGVKDFSDYEKIKDRIVCRLVNRESNRSILSDSPFTPYEDLAVTYYILVSADVEGKATCRITNQLLQNYSISVNELHSQAMENMKTLTPLKFTSLTDTIREPMMKEAMESMGMSKEEAKSFLEGIMPAEEAPIYVATCQDGINGAAVIANDEYQELISDKVNGDYYVLPSSIHEVLIVPKSNQMTPGELQDMVHEVNSTQVAEDEVLSGQVYEYQAKEHRLTLCDTKDPIHTHRQSAEHKPMSH